MAGLGAFIDSAMQGYGFAADIEDAKYRKGRRKKDDEWTDKTRARAEVVWVREDEAHKRAAEERSVLAAIAKDARDSYNNGVEADTQAPSVPNPVPEQDPTTLSTRNAPVPRGVADVAPERPDLPQPAAEAPVQRPPQPRSVIAPEADTAPQVDEEPPMPNWRDKISGDSEVIALLEQDAAIRVMADRRSITPRAYIASMSPEAVEHNLRRIAGPEKFNKAADDAAFEASAGRRGMEEPMPTQADLDQRYREDQRAERFSYSSSTRRGDDPNPIVSAPVSPSPEAQVARPDTPAAPVAPAGEDASEVVRAATAPVAPSVPAEERAEVQALHEKAISAPPDQGGSPSVAVAAATAPETRGVIGPDGAVKTTKKERDHATKSFLDHYAETAVPKLIEYYASQGDIEKAQAFEDWAKSREAKGQMESWSRAVHAAAIGDDDAFLDHLSDTYNSYDDGYEVIRDGSGFVRDGAGNITGAEIKFKNTKTGEVFVEHFEDQSDIIEMGIYALSPEQVFEHMWGKLAQSAEIAAEQRKFERDLQLERAKAGMKAPADNARAIRGAKKDLSEAYAIYPHPTIGKMWAQMTHEEQDKAALDYVRGNQSLGQQLDQPAAPPLYTGE